MNSVMTNQDCLRRYPIRGGNLVWSFDSQLPNYPITQFSAVASCFHHNESKIHRNCLHCSFVPFVLEWRETAGCHFCLL